MDKISVLMAVYNPPAAWLEEQLRSIDGQTYPNIELYICDDCSPAVQVGELEELVSRCVTSVPYHIYRNEENVGSNRTFEWLTGVAAGAYFAYCDQDDVWYPDKLSKELSYLCEKKALMVCTNADVIDSEGICTSRRYMSIPTEFQKVIDGDEAWKTLLIKNYFWGCTLVIKAETAKDSLPFVRGMYHDQYLELYAAMQGRIAFLDESMMAYRIHGSNQTGFLKDVHSKQEYVDRRVRLLENRFLLLQQREYGTKVQAVLEDMLDWTRNREKYAEGDLRAGIRMLRGINYSRQTILFELCTMWLPSGIWNFILAALKRWKSMHI